MRCKLPTRIILLIILLFISVGCNNKEKENELLDKIKELETQLDECENGAEKLQARMKLSFEKGKYAECKSIYKEMEKRHPNSELLTEVQLIYQKIIKIEDEKEEEIRVAKENDRKEKLKTLKKLKKDYDDVSGVTWYKQPYFSHYNNENYTSIYLGQKDNSLWLRLKMSYSGDDWIFFDNAYLSYEGNTKEIYFDKYNDKKTENGYGGVWEWIDVEVSKELELFLRDFTQSKDTVKSKIPVYYLGTNKVSKSEYDKNDGYIYRLEDNEIVKKSLYEAYKKSGLYKLPVPKKVEKRIEYKANVSIKINAKMRLSGKYTKTRNLSVKEIKGIEDVLNGYDALKESLTNKY